MHSPDGSNRMYHRLFAAFVVASTPLGAATSAQSTVEPGPEQSIEIDQVPSSGRRLSSPSTQPSQIAPAALRESAARTEQIYRGAKTAQSSSSPSQPRDGRKAYIGRIAGEDRCDRRSKKARSLSACTNVIETRAAAFPPPEAPALTNEQRLLATQHGIRGTMNTKILGQHLADDGSPDTPEGQAVASLILRALAKDQAAAETVAAARPEESAASLIPMIVPPLPAP